jgi:glucose-6-phosphate 1-epimerase
MGTAVAPCLAQSPGHQRKESAMKSDTTQRSPAGSVPGTNGLPKLLLRAADGALAEVYLHGAHVTSWLPAGAADERLFLSATSRFADGEPIRGGVPVCFPQFADQGPLPMHGFVRTSAWSLLAVRQRADGVAEAVLRFRDTPATRALWPHAFTADLTVSVSGRTLVLALEVTNDGDAPLAFTGALHTYLRVANAPGTFVRGLEGAHYRDKVAKLDDVVEKSARLAVDRPLDRVYRTAPPVIGVEEPGRTTKISATGFADTVVWNPGPAKSPEPSDLEPDGYLRMLCVEAAAASTPVEVAPGATWRGTQMLVAA